MHAGRQPICLQFVFVFLVMTLLVWGKDVFLIYLYLKSDGSLTPYEDAIVFCCFFDALLVVVTRSCSCMSRARTCASAQPLSLYYGWYLYQSLQTSLTFDKITA